MQAITTTEELRKAILLLEIKQANEGKLLKEQFSVTYESLKPVNLIKNTFSELITAPDLKGNLLNAVISLTAGYLTKKTIVGQSHNPIKTIIGSLLQMGVSNLVAKNADGIKSSVSDLINNFLNRNKKT
jgi:hypothetical protein